MRKFEKLGMGTAALVALACSMMLSAPAQAAGGFITCDEFATAAADTATRDEFQPAGDFESAVPGKILVIAAGQKFYMPKRQIDAGTLGSVSVWQRMRDWNTAYSDAFWRCRHADALTLQVRK